MIGLLTSIFLLLNPCPDGMTQAECQLCWTLYELHGIPFEECPCWDGGDGSFVPPPLPPDPDVQGACCTPSFCFELDCEEACYVLDGTFYPGDTCDDISGGACIHYVPETYGLGGCCIANECSEDVPEELCLELDGYYMGDDVPCDGSCPSEIIQGTEGACCLGATASGSWDPDHYLCVYVVDIETCDSIGGYFELDRTCGEAYCAMLDLMDDLDVCDEQSDDVYACCLDNDCYNFTSETCNDLGGLWISGFLCSEYDCVNNEGDVGACCIGSACVETYSPACSSMGGQFNAGQMCDAVDCSDGDGDGGGGGDTDYGACCLDGGMCIDNITQGNCDNQNGTFYLDGDCSLIDCVDPGSNTGACCYSDGTCLVVTNAQCLSDNGVYKGDGVACNNRTCDYDDLCECILLEAILDTNQDMLASLVDMNYSLNDIKEFIESIYANTDTMIELGEALLGANTLIAYEQLPRVLEILEAVVDGFGDVNTDPMLYDQDGDLVELDVENTLYEMALSTSGVEQAGQSAMPSINEILDEEEYAEPGSAPVFVLDASDLAFSINGYSFQHSNNFEFDTGMLDDWVLAGTTLSVRNVIHWLCMLWVSWWAICLVAEEVRKY